jgi:hypothetical protein
LAGESAAYDIGKSGWKMELGNIFIAGHFGPMVSQHGPGLWIDLAERDGLEPARPFQP